MATNKKHLTRFLCTYRCNSFLIGNASKEPFENDTYNLKKGIALVIRDSAYKFRIINFKWMPR